MLIIATFESGPAFAAAPFPPAAAVAAKFAAAALAAALPGSGLIVTDTALPAGPTGADILP